jgi:hypothetical protein
MLKTREETLEAAASKCGMDEKTARKCLRSGKLPSQSKVPHTWKTRKDPFAGVWEDVRKRLGTTPGVTPASTSTANIFIDPLKPAFVAKKPPPSHVFSEVVLIAAEEGGGCF